jgi:hypothetical protein
MPSTLDTLHVCTREHRNKYCFNIYHRRAQVEQCFVGTGSLSIGTTSTIMHAGAPEQHNKLYMDLLTLCVSCLQFCCSCCLTGRKTLHPAPAEQK